MQEQLTLPESAAEEWRPVLGWEGWYEVSSAGNVRRCAAGRSTRNGRFLKPQSPPGRPYLMLRLNRPDLNRSYVVHRLVAEAFLGTRPDKAEANHINGDKHDNRAENLEWLSRLGNIGHAWRTGLFKPPRGVKNPRARLTEEDVRWIRANSNLKGTDVASKFGVNKATIYDILKFRHWQHVS